MKRRGERRIPENVRDLITLSTETAVLSAAFLSRATGYKIQDNGMIDERNPRTHITRDIGGKKVEVLERGSPLFSRGTMAAVYVRSDDAVFFVSANQLLPS